MPMALTAEMPCGQTGSPNTGVVVPSALHLVGSLKKRSGMACSSALMYWPLSLL